jgi:autotransporter-associated beta strand protein
MKTKLLTAAIVALATSCVLLNARADIVSGLVGYWNLSDGPGSSTVADSSGNGNTGTLVNFTDTTYNNMWTSPGDPNNGWPFALLFNQSGEGANTYISIPDSPSLNTPSTNKQWTLSAWVNCSMGGASQTANAGIICKGNLNAEAYTLFINSAGKFTTTFHNAAGSGTETVSSTTVPVAGTWYHVAATVLEPKGSADAEAMVYVNGVRESPANANTYTTVYITNLQVTIGCRAAANGTINLPFQGTIDEVRIYNRALTASDILQLYNNKAFGIINNGIGAWNGLVATNGNATLDTTSLNFSTNVYTTPFVTAGNLANVLSVEQASSLPPGCAFADTYYSSGSQLPVAATNLTIVPGGIALGTASAAGTVTFQNAALTYVLTSPDGIGLKDGPNPTSLVKSGSGTLILIGNNTLSGGVTIDSGSVQLGNGGSITGQELGTANSVTDNGTLVFAGSNSLAFSRTISGTGAVTQKGSGTLTLTAANSYSGGTTLSNGTVSAASLSDSGTSSLGTGAINLNSGTLLYTGTSDSTARGVNATTGTTNNLNVPNGVTMELSGQVQTSGSTFTLNKTGGGTLTLSGSADNAHLTMAINAGTVILNKFSASNVHALGGGPTTVGNGATLQLSGSGTAETSTTCALTVNEGGVFDLNGQYNTLASLSLAGTGIGGNGSLINSAANTVATLIGPITLTTNAILAGPGSMTLPSAASGTGALTYAGGGVLMLQSANTYSGGTIISSGNLDATVANCLPGNVTINGSGSLQLDDPAALSSVSTLTLPNSPSNNIVNLNYGGTSTIAVLMLGSTAMPAGTYGPGATNPNGAFTGSGQLIVTGQADWDPGHSAASPGSGGVGTWDVVSGNWFAGTGDHTWPMDAVALFAGTAGTVTVTASVNADGLTFTTPGYIITSLGGLGGATLTLDNNNPTINVPAGNTTIACTIAESGANPVTINGPGTLTLTGANTYAGGTTLNGATLSAKSISDGNCSIGPSGTLTMLGGSALSYTGAGPASTTRNVTASGAATCLIDVPAGTLTLAGQVRNAGGNSAQMFTKTGAGTLVLGGTTDNPSLTMAINQGAVIITKSSATNVHGLGGGTSTVASNATLQLSGTGNYDLFSSCVLTVNSGGLFDLGGQSDTMSTLTISGAGLDGTGALINSAASTTAFLTNNGSGLILAGPTTVGGPGNIALAGKVSGSGPITYAGTGNLTLTNANSYTAGTIINAGGTVTFGGSASSAGTGQITDNGTLAVAIVGNNATLANAIIGPGVINLVETSANNLQLGGSMSGFTGTINCPISPGGTAKAQILTTNVGLSSAATINLAAGGTLYVASSGVIIPCAMNIYGLGNSETYGALRVENNAVVSGPVTLYGNTTMGNGQTGTSKLATIGGPISQSGGSYGITFTAEPGTIVLSGTNTYTGATTISMTSTGQLVIGGSGQLGAGNYAAPITNNATFNYASSAPQTLSGVITGTGTLIQSGPGVLTLSGANSFTGGVLVTNGSVLAVAGSGCLGVSTTATNYAGAITNYGTLAFNSTVPQTLSGGISGTGNLIQNGSGALTLGAGNTYTGDTFITNVSTLVVGSAGSINTTRSVNIAAGATFDVSAYSAYTSLGSIALGASGTGTTVGSTAATIKAAASAGATVTLAGPLALTLTPQSFKGDTNHPALYVAQIGQGQLVLDGNAITVTNAGSSPLGAGTYSLIQVAAGGSISAGSPTVTVVGKGLASGATASISISGGSVNLVVSGGTSAPAINSVALSGGNLIFSGTNGPSGGNYYVLASTNVALPLLQWTSIATNTFSPTGTFSVTNSVAVNPRQFFIIQVP